MCNISATSGLILKFSKLLNPDTSLNLTVHNVSTATQLYNHTTTYNNYYVNTIFIVFN